eukprot:1275536-Amphidinium_carterae.1
MILIGLFVERLQVQQVKTLKKRTTSEKIDAKGLAVSQKVQHWRKEMPAGSAGSAQAAARDPPQPPDVHEKGQDQRQQHQDGLKTAHSCRSLEQPLIEAKDAEEEKGVKQVLPGGVEEETQELQSETCAQGFDSPSSAQEDGMQPPSPPADLFRTKESQTDRSQLPHKHLYLPKPLSYGDQAPTQPKAKFEIATIQWLSAKPDEATELTLESASVA